jgi:hypothetical protein
MYHWKICKDGYYEWQNEKDWGVSNPVAYSTYCPVKIQTMYLPHTHKMIHMLDKFLDYKVKFIRLIHNVHHYVSHKRGLIKNIRDKFFIEKLLIVSKWQSCRILGNISWRHIQEERVAAWLSREWVDLQCNRVCPSVILWNGCLEGATCLHQVLPENWVRQPQKRTKCYNKHSEKQRWVGPRHLSGIPNLKMAVCPSMMIHTQAGHQQREPTRLLTVSIQ